jgi:hypothetical protein
MAIRRNRLKKLFSLLAGTTSVVGSSVVKASPAEEALLHQIAERSKIDPLIGAKIGSKEKTQRLLAGMKTERGVHIESLLCALGAIAGYACQASVRALALSRGMVETGLLVSVATKDGKTYCFGDELNKPLAESKYSVWGLSAGAAQKPAVPSLWMFRRFSNTHPRPLEAPTSGSRAFRPNMFRTTCR